MELNDSNKRRQPRWSGLDKNRFFAAFYRYRYKKKIDIKLLTPYCPRHRRGNEEVRNPRRDLIKPDWTEKKISYKTTREKCSDKKQTDRWKWISFQMECHSINGDFKNSIDTLSVKSASVACQRVSTQFIYVFFSSFSCVKRTRVNPYRSIKRKRWQEWCIRQC